MDLHAIMTLAVERKASDVHLAPDSSPVYRLDGGIRSQKSDFAPLTAAQTETMLYGILREDQRHVLNKEMELDLSYHMTLPEGPVRFRVNIHRQQHGLGAVFRLISDVIPSAEEITLEESVQQLATLPRGLVLLTGPTGSGKSTTLACLIDYINRHYRKHILTIEDPIEYLHRSKLCNITQRELATHTHGFAPALKSGLRMDPDVILIGEMRDLETIQLALTASETGHLVFSTVHTTDASQTVDRIIDVFPSGQQSMVRSQLASVLQGIVTQVLLPKAEGTGRVAAREILLANSAVRTLIRESNSHQVYSAMASGVQAGMCPLELSLAAKVKQRLISEEQATMVANRPSIFRNYLENKTLPFSAPGLSGATKRDAPMNFDEDDLVKV